MPTLKALHSISIDIERWLTQDVTPNFIQLLNVMEKLLFRSS